MCSHTAKILHMEASVAPLASAEAIHSCHAVHYDAVYVRRLCHPLNLSQVAAVQRYATEVCHHDVVPTAPSNHTPPSDHIHSPFALKVTPPGKTSEMPHSEEEALVLMSSTQRDGYLSLLTCGAHVERFLTTRLIANMFCTAEAAVGEEHTYLAATPDEQLLCPVQDLLCLRHGDHVGCRPRSPFLNGMCAVVAVLPRCNLCCARSDSAQGL
jgi:hypothetical protein